MPGLGFIQQAIVTDSAVAWAAHWTNIGEHFRKDVDDVVIRGAILEGAKTMIMETPILTGRARGNYEVDEKAGTDYKWDRYDDGVGTYNRILKKVLATEWPEKAVIWNAIPYVKQLDEGTKKNRAHAMTEKTILAVERYMNRVNL